MRCRLNVKAAGECKVKQLTDEEIAELQTTYRDLINYQAASPTEPIDPLAYRAADGDRLIHIAAHRGDLRTVEMLLDAGEDVNSTGELGDTAAHYAAMELHKDVFDLLMARGADPTITNDFGDTAAETWAFFQEEKGRD